MEDMTITISVTVTFTVWIPFHSKALRHTVTIIAAVTVT